MIGNQQVGRREMDAENFAQYCRIAARQGELQHILAGGQHCGRGDFQPTRFERGNCPVTIVGERGRFCYQPGDEQRGFS